jgi:hypothetical protein
MNIFLIQFLSLKSYCCTILFNNKHQYENQSKEVYKSERFCIKT